MKIEIKCRFSLKVLFECEADSLKLGVEKAVALRANLYGANLYGANLTRANLYGANLDGANLDGANLDGANLYGANLENIKKDFFEKLALAQNEVVGLYKALVDGKIDGSVYHGEFACFVGTIANLRGVDYESLADSINLIANSDSPTERWFMAIQKGDTPEGNKVSKVTKEWLEEFLTGNAIVIPTRTVTWT